MSHRSFIASLLLTASGIGGGADVAPQITPVPSIVFSPLDSIPRPLPDGRVIVGCADYMDLFTPSSPWEVAASHIQVFKFYPQFASRASDAELKTAVADLKRRGIAIGMEMGSLRKTETCGEGVEGFGGEQGTALARRIRDAGGTLSFVDVDEPYTWGCRYTGKNSCQMAPEQAAREVADFIKDLRTIFPAVVIGDAEGLGNGVGHPVTVADLEQWLETYQRVAGEPFAFFIPDTQWTRPGVFAELHELQDWVQSHGMRFGVIYDGNPGDTTDAAWLAHAEDAFSIYERPGVRRPDFVLMQSWHPHPQRLLPESDPATFTHLINAYFRPSSELQLAAHDNADSTAWTITGRVVGEDGTAVRQADIALFREIQSDPGESATYVISGNVPTQAASANVGWRMNCEGAGTGACNLTLSEIRMEIGSENLVANGDFTSGLAGWHIREGSLAEVEQAPLRGLLLRTAADQSTMANSDAFSVPVGATYHFAVTARVAPSSADHGYFDLIFLAADGKEVLREKIPFAAARSPVGDAFTQADGTFTARIAHGPGSYLIEARFAGDDRWRPTTGAVVLPFGK